jgi:hypothetical protein
MNEVKYVRLQHVQELVSLYKKRDRFEWWSDEHEKYDRKIEKTIAWLKHNAKPMSERA